MPFNGSGTFNRLYSWVQDAANGVNIDATRMDNEFNGVATALTDCVTRDGQSPFTANIPAGGFKITGLGTPTASTDAATKAYVDGSAGSEWLTESSGSLAWVSTTQFKVIGIDVTARYHAGRRVKITHNSGSTVTYATVVSSSFSSDTTVTVATDTGASLVSQVTAVSYGLLSYANPSYLDPRTAIAAALSSDQAYTASSAAKIQLSDGQIDALGEYDAQTNYRFTAKHPGYYFATLTVDFVQTGSAARNVVPLIYKNGTEFSRAAQNDGLVVSAGARWSIPMVLFLSLDKGDYLEAWFSSANSGSIKITNTGGGAGTRLQVLRLA